MIQISSCYTLKSLKEENDIQKWSEFCASCFLDKKPYPPPSSYFSRHFFNDPWRVATLIFVIQYTEEHPNRDHDHDHDNGATVASTRVFLREISLGYDNGTCWAGGIGEVCTHPSHRKRGLAKHLLHCAIQVMQEYNKGQLQCSLLHASPAYMKVYETDSANYKGVATHWSILTLKTSKTTRSGSCSSIAIPESTRNQFTIRLASFPKDTCQLQRIHKEYSQDRFVGCIIRTREYWNEYLCKEIGDSMFVLCCSNRQNSGGHNRGSDCDSDSGNGSESNNHHDKILSWMYIKVRSDTRIQLGDFGCCKTTCRQENISMSTAFTMLFEHIVATDKTIPLKSSSSSSSSSLELAIPSPVYQELISSPSSSSSSPLSSLSPPSTTQSTFLHGWLDPSKNAREECDPGWMYRHLQQEGQPLSPLLEIMKTHNLPHLIWPADSF
jgi:GNAT superfamily N-acetyltransferase